MSILPRTVPSKKLAQALLSTDTSLVLNNITDWDGGDLASGDFGTQLFATLTNDTKTKLEIIELDPTTIASGAITILNRGLPFNGQYVSVPALALDWAANETTVQLGSDVPQLFNNYVDFAQDQTIGGQKTFSTIPKYVGTPTASDDIANKAYVDAAALGGSTVDEIIIAGTAGEAIAVGEFVYFDEATQKWLLTDASAGATSRGLKIGIAQIAAVLNDPVNVLVSGLDQNQTGMTPGSKYYLSDTAGAISSTPGTVEVFVGWAEDADTFIFNHISDVETANADEKAALAGTVGTPSDTNRYVTNDDTTGAGAIVRGSGGVTGSILIYSSTTPPSGWLHCDGQAINIDTYSDLFAVIDRDYGVSVGTAFTAEPVLDIITSNAHGLSDGDRVYLTNSGGALPTGLSTIPIYYIISATTNTFQLSLTQGGGAVDFTDAGSGTHNWHTEVLIPNLVGRTVVGIDTGDVTFNTLNNSGGAKEVLLTKNESALVDHTHQIEQGTSANTNVNPFIVSGEGHVGGGPLTGLLARTAGRDALEAHENMPPYVVLNYIIKT